MAISDVINELTSRTARVWSPPSWWNLLIALPWVIGLVFLLFSSASDQAIAGRERTTYGIIRTHEPENHNRFGYEFSVSGKLFTGWQIPMTDFKIGQKVLCTTTLSIPPKVRSTASSDPRTEFLGPLYSAPSAP
jgi:hypothetical protein